MEIRHLRYFVTVAEELHFNRAAERLHIAQPALSFNIKTLEQELGISLLNRTTRKVELTPEGRTFLRQAQVALDAFDTAQTVGEQLRRGELGTVSVGGSSQVRQRLSGILSEFHHRYPQAETSAREQGTSQVLDAVVNGEIDVGLGVAPEVRDQVCYRTIAHDELVLVVPKDHALAGEASVQLTAVEHENLLLPSDRRAAGSNRAILDMCAEAGFTPHVTFGNTDHDQRFQSVLAGEGVEFKLRDYIVELASHGVSILSLDPPLTLPVQIFWRSERCTPQVARFLDLAAAVADGASGMADSMLSVA